MYLSSIGIEVSKIMLLARWDSPVVFHYCRLAPLKTITQDFKKATLKHSHIRTGVEPNELEALLRKSTLKVKRQMHEFAKHYEVTRQGLLEAMTTLEKKVGPKEFLDNRKNRMGHRVLASVLDAGNAAITVCGCKYAKAIIKTTRNACQDLKLRCDTCFPEAKHGIDTYPM